MRNFSVLILHLFVTQSYAEEHMVNVTSDMQDSMDKLADKLIDKLVGKLVNQARTGHLAIPQRVSPSAPHAPLLLPHWPAMFHAAHSVRTPRAPRAESEKPMRVVRDGAAPGPLQNWPVVYQRLLDAGVQTVPIEEASDMVKKKGAVIVDVRMEDAFAGGTPEGAVNVPFFKYFEGDGSAGANLKKVAAFFVGLPAKERNPDFNTMALEKLPKNKPLIVTCDRGGNLDGSRTNSFGTAKEYSDTDQYTLSLKAAYLLYEAGFTQLSIMKGGISNWRAKKLPMVGV